MRSYFKLFNKRDYIAFAIVALGYFILILQTCPISHDDFNYRFSQIDRVSEIRDFSGLLQSNIYGYMHLSGRFLVHSCVQFFLSFSEFYLFYIACTIMFVLLCMSAMYLIRTRCGRTRGDIAIFIGLFVLFIPLCATLIYGTVAMNINYMWSISIYLLFLSVHNHLSNDEIHYNWIQNILLLLFGFICGAWQESFCIGIAGVLAIYYVFHLKNIKPELWYLLIGFAVGALVLCLAPGNFVRFDKYIVPERSVGTTAYILFMWLKHNFFIWCWMLVGVVSIIIDIIKKKKPLFIVQNWAWFGSAVITFIFTIYTFYKGVFQGIWQLTFFAVWDVIIVFMFLQTYLSKSFEKINKYVIISLCVGLVGLYSYVVFYRYQLKTKVIAFEEQVINAKENTAIIYDGELKRFIHDEVPENPFIWHLICPIYADEFQFCLYEMDRFYHGGNRLGISLIMPDDPITMALQCNDKNMVSENVYHISKAWDIIRLPECDTAIEYNYRYEVKKNSLYYKTTRLFTNKNDVVIVKDIADMPNVSYDGFTYYVCYYDWFTYHETLVHGQKLRKGASSAYNEKK